MLANKPTDLMADIWLKASNKCPLYS